MPDLVYKMFLLLVFTFYFFSCSCICMSVSVDSAGIIKPLFTHAPRMFDDRAQGEMNYWAPTLFMF